MKSDYGILARLCTQRIPSLIVGLQLEIFKGKIDA